MRKYQAGEPLSEEALIDLALLVDDSMVFIVPLNRTKFARTVINMPFMSVRLLLRNGHICKVVERPKRKYNYERKGSNT